MPVFNDSQPVVPLVPEGDYDLVVEQFEQGVSTGLKTKGSDLYEMRLAIQPSGEVVERLIDAPNSAWKIDLFLKSAGVQLPKGSAFEFREDLARKKNVPWIDPIGLRVRAHIIIEQYLKKDGTQARKNAVGAYLMNGTLNTTAVRKPQATPEEPW